LQISDRGDYACSNFLLCLKISPKCGLWTQILHFWTIILLQKKFQQFSNSPEFKEMCRCLPALRPWCHCMHTSTQSARMKHRNTMTIIAVKWTRKTAPTSKHIRTRIYMVVQQKAQSNFFLNILLKTAWLCQKRDVFVEGENDHCACAVLRDL